MENALANYYSNLFGSTERIYESGYIVLSNCTVPNTITLTNGTVLTAGTFIEQISVELPKILFETAAGDSIGVYEC